MRPNPARFLTMTAAAAATLAVLAGCSSGNGNNSGSGTKSPIVVGVSLSLSGDFSVDGQGFERGYQLWASDVNSHGGLLGRQVKLDILNDTSSPTQVVTNYQKLINVNHVDLLFGPFSSLLTAPAAQIANRYGKAFVEGAAGAQAVVLGSVDVPTVSAFIQAFAQQHYNPKIVIATAGPDQGASFVSAVGKGNAEGVMVPNGWYGGYQDAASQAMVQEYVAKYVGSASGINSDVAEGYAVGEVMAQAVNATHGLDNAKIISYLHSGVTLTSVQGPVQFDAAGENGKPAAFIFQWQKGSYVQVLPTGTSGSVAVQYPKSAWGG